MKIFQLNYLSRACLLLSCLVYSASYADSNVTRLNDTGIQYGGDYPKGINSSCEGTITSENTDEDIAGNILVQQDCATGISATDKAINGDVFSYVKIDQKGQELKNEATEWHCVLDQVSGLMWEVKNTSEDNLHFYEDKFTWYSSNKKTNGGNIGNWNSDGSQCHGYVKGDPITYCHIEQFADRVNKQGLCGFDDWRVPTSTELTSVINFGQTEPAINETYFPNTLDNFYWTNNPASGSDIQAWAINFHFGNSSPIRKTDLKPVRLVRSANK